MFQAHNHGECSANGMARAQALCESRGLRLTPARRRVLEILLERHRALGAYDILETLTEEGLGSKPPTVYRALDFLVQNGLAHKVQSLNAFVACLHADAGHTPFFLVCRPCGAVLEANLPEHLSTTAAAHDFEIETSVMEATGICPDCKANA